MIQLSEILHGKILIVDDLPANVALLNQMLARAGYDGVTSTTDPAQACDLHFQNNFDLILLDLAMPGLDGFQVMEKLKELEPEGYLPVLVITAQSDQKLHALLAGAKDFISKPFEFPEVLARVHNMVEVRLLHKQLHHANEVLEQRVLERTSDLQDSYQETIFAMMRAAEFKDEDTGFHVQRISFYARELARILGMGEPFIDQINFASPMHDIGKIRIHDEILLKRGSLSPEEWEIMKGHAVMGAEILGQGKSPYLKMGVEIALDHHEHWDGGGYPNGKSGEAIPISARIMTICDTYDALRSKRPYKPVLGHLKTMEIITHGDGRTLPTNFDPVILKAFVENDQKFE